MYCGIAGTKYVNFYHFLGHTQICPASDILLEKSKVQRKVPGKSPKEITIMLTSVKDSENRKPRVNKQRMCLWKVQCVFSTRGRWQVLLDDAYSGTLFCWQVIFIQGVFKILLFFTFSGLDNSLKAPKRVLSQRALNKDCKLVNQTTLQLPPLYNYETVKTYLESWIGPRVACFHHR